MRSKVGRYTGDRSDQTNLSADNSEFTMQLTPKDLGELTVKMTAKDGVLTIELTAADPKTQHLLNQKAGEIQSAIQSSQDKQVQISCPTHHQTQNQDLFKQSDSHARQQQQQSRQNEEENQAFASTESFLNMLQQMDLVAV